MLQLFSEVNGTRKLLDFMLDNLAVSTSHPQSRQMFKPNIFFPRKTFKQIFNVHGSGPGSSFNPWTGRTLPPFSQSCATMFFVTGGAKFHCSFVYRYADKYSNQFAQVCNTQPLWLLPTVGSKLGVQVTQDRRAISLELRS